jgi:hypothetical protein
MLARHTDPSHALPSTVTLAQPGRHRVRPSQRRVQYINGKALVDRAAVMTLCREYGRRGGADVFGMRRCARAREKESEASDDAYSSFRRAVMRSAEILCSSANVARYALVRKLVEV